MKGDESNAFLVRPRKELMTSSVKKLTVVAMPIPKLFKIKEHLISCLAANSVTHSTGNEEKAHWESIYSRSPQQRNQDLT